MAPRRACLMAPRRACLIAAVSLTGSGAAAADEWRDGCPAGMRSHYRRSDFRMGAVPDPATGLTQNRLTLSAIQTYGSDHPDLANHYTVHAVAHVHLEYPFPLRPVLDVLVPSTNDSGQPEVVGLPALRVGFRKNYLGSLDASALHAADARSVAGFRKSYAVQIWTAGTGGAVTGDGLVAANRLPFEYYLFAPDRSVGGRFEYRLETVGCYAPFLHFLAEAIVTPSLGQPTGSDVLIGYISAVTAGAMLEDHISVAGQYALSVLQLGTREFSVHHRFRVAGEWSASRYIVGLYVDVITRGSGAALGVYVGVNDNHGYL